MKYEILEKDEFFVVGMPIKVSLSEPDYQSKIKKLWKDFVLRIGEIKNRKNDLCYGLCNISEGIKGDDCSFEHIAGVEVNSKDKIPKGMKFQKVAKSKYFVATHKGRLEKIGETYCWIEKEMKKLKLEEDRGKIFFELYDERFKEDSNDSEFDIYSTIKD